MRTDNPQLWQPEVSVHPRRRFQSHLQNMAGYSNAIVPSGPPSPEPNAAVNKALFFIHERTTVRQGISLAEARPESVTRVERSVCRAVQDALTDLRRHSGGSKVDGTADAAEVRFEVAGSAR